MWRQILSVFAAVAVVAAAPARAEKLVLEVHVGPRPANADKFLGPVRDELLRLRFGAITRLVARALGMHAARPGVTNPYWTFAQIRKDIEDGSNEVLAANDPDQLARAMKKLEDAEDGAYGNLGLLVQQPDARALLFQSLLARALALEKVDSKEMERVFAELIRSNPDHAFTRKNDGPRAAPIYQLVYKELYKSGVGTLTIEVTDPDALVYVDEVLHEPGTIAGLAPGIYRVLVKVGDSTRQYRVEVVAKQDTLLHVDWDVDSHLVLTDQWAGFQFLTPKESASALSYADRLTRTNLGDDGVVLLKLNQDHGRADVDGVLYSLTKHRVLREAIAPAAANDASVVNSDALRALARFLAGEAASNELTILANSPVPATPVDAGAATTTPTASPIANESPSTPDPDEHPQLTAGSADAGDRKRRSRVVPVLLLGVGTGALAVGGVMILKDGVPSNVGQQEPTYRDYRKPGIGTAIGGAVAIAAGVLLLLRSDSASAPSVAISRGGGSLGWTGRF